MSCEKISSAFQSEFKYYEFSVKSFNLSGLQNITYKIERKMLIDQIFMMNKLNMEKCFAYCLGNRESRQI